MTSGFNGNGINERHDGSDGASLIALGLGAGFAHAQSNEDLAKKLSNPIASLVSVPFQFNYDQGYGPDDGNKATLNIQPVIPIEAPRNIRPASDG